MRISVGKNRTDKKWRVVSMSWTELTTKLSQTIRTPETVSEYKNMDKDHKAYAKDVGGFVGGVVLNGARRKSNISCRTLVTLDADYASVDSWDNATVLLDCAMCCYSTHSHTKKSPRLRFVIPLDREVTCEEYEPIARMVAKDIGIDQFDVTTYETSRLMYWASTSSDGDFIFEKQDGEFLSADSTLARYQDWKDTTEWPIGMAETTIRNKLAKAQGNPEEKPGAVGLFCRTYDIPSVIDKFLSDVYSPCEIENRYTYIQGSTTAGAVLYGGGSFLYSHHSTDPTCMKLCNAFDLVRIHKFGDLDYEVDKDVAINKTPSYQAMLNLVNNDDECKITLAEEKMAQAKDAFSETFSEDNLDWATQLQTNKNGAYEATTNNLVCILENDPNLKDVISYNEFKGIPCIINDAPWRTCRDKTNGTQWEDEDMAALTHYIETTYGIYNQGKLSAAFNVVMQRHSFHPIRNYLNNLQWDGVKRTEGLFINYLGAEDNKYTRTVTRKWFTAAVARIMNPGCKFDNLIVLVGAQGIGKSYLGNMLGRGWFSDTFTTVQGKDAYEQLKGCWIIEIAELSAMKKAEVESVKMFISKQEDNYRGAYREFARVNKRQCVFYGTTNDDSFLRDRTGNRRFWVISVDKTESPFDVFDLKDNDVNQMWAEAVYWYKRGESLYLDSETSVMAAKEQSRFMTVDPRQGVIEAYLEKPIPVNWEKMSRADKRNYIQGYLEYSGETKLRKTISIPELAYELYGEDPVEPYRAKEYHSMLTGLPKWKKTGARIQTYFGRQYVYERIEDANT